MHKSRRLELKKLACPKFWVIYLFVHLLSLSLSLSHSLSLSFSLSLSLSLILSLTHSLSLSLISHKHTRTHTNLTNINTLSVSHTVRVSVSLSLSFSLSAQFLICIKYLSGLSHLLFYDSFSFSHKQIFQALPHSAHTHTQLDQSKQGKTNIEVGINLYKG